MDWVASRAGLAPGSPIDSPRATLRTATDGRDVLFNSPDGWEVDNPFLWWTSGDGTYGNPLTADDPTGWSTMAAVSRCTSIICDKVAGLPWRVLRGDYEVLATPTWVADPQVSRIDGRVVDPATLLDTRLGPVEFWANWICAALWFGNGYVYAPVRDAAGAPQPPLWQLHPHKVRVEDGSYWVDDVALPYGSVIHLRGMLPYWNAQGRGVITAHGAELGLMSLVRSYASGVFQSGVPAGYLKSTQPSMTADQAAQLKAAWLAQHGGAKRSIAVLNATTDFTPIQISPVDAQLNAAREWSLRDIALAFGVPAYMLGVPGDSSTYVNIQSRMLELAQFTLMPWVRRIESTLDSEFPAGTSLKVDMRAMLRADDATRSAFYASGIAEGWLTINEVRALEDYPPLPETEGVV
jgi:HK97 family phage portal protein